MKDEIKEIIESSRKIIKSNRENGFDRIIMLGDDIDKLLDYITNLQEELKSANESITWWQNRFNAVEKENERLKEENKRIFSKVNDDELLISNAMNYAEAQDYKSKCEKAIEYNEQIIKDTKDFYRPTSDVIYSGDTLIDIATQNINILNGGDKD